MENKFVEFRYCLRTVRRRKGRSRRFTGSDEEEKSTDDAYPSKLTMYGEADNARGDMLWNMDVIKAEQSMALRVAHASVGKFGAGDFQPAWHYTGNL
jgi:hypothetical protein